MTQAQTVAKLLDEHGRTFADEAGITLRDKPSPLFQLLQLTMLFSAPISAQVAVATARGLFRAGWRTPERLLESTWQERVDVLGRGGYRRYDESTATYLAEAAQLLRERYRGDLRRLRDDAGSRLADVEERLQEFPRIGPTGAAIFCREVQSVWPSIGPVVDKRVQTGARAVGLPTDAGDLTGLVPVEDRARLTAALVRVDRHDEADVRRLRTG